MFLQRFLISNLWNALLICVMLGLKRILRDRISLKFQYRSWYALFASLTLSFLPNGLWANLEISRPGGENYFAIPTAVKTAPHMATGDGWLYDTTQLAGGSSLDRIAPVILSVWLLGVIGMLGIYWFSAQKLRRIRRYAASPAENIQALFEPCKHKIVPDCKVELKESRLVSSPVSFGFHPYVVVLPREHLHSLSPSELRHILLHELTHIRHGDLLLNFLVCGIQALFWFNPFVWLAMGQLRRDREAYCDWAVVNGFASEEERIGYGRTILRFAAIQTNVRSGLANGFCEGKSQLKYRLEQIVAFRRETGLCRVICSACAAALLLLSIVQVPVMALCVKHGEEYYTPSDPLSITEEDFGPLFQGAKGCAVVYDRNADRYTAYNPDEMTRRLPPCSTYKIYSGLNALEMGLISPQSSTLSWDGTQYRIPNWNEDQDLSCAMHNSTNWYFTQLDRSAGLDNLARFYQRIGYGNCNVGSDVTAYWNGSALRVSPLEQVELLVKLYENAFGFQEANVQTVLDSMRLLSEDDAVLYGKTGTGELDGRNIAGWFIGFAEKADNVYFFAIYLCSDAGSDGAAATDTAFQILEQMHIL